MINLLFSILSFVIRPLGYLLMAYGNIYHKLKWVAFGNYITGTGRRLRVKQSWAVKAINGELPNDNNDSSSYYCVSTADKWYNFSPWSNSDIYNTFGKAKLTKYGLYDIYQFYEICDNAEKHWKDCNCEKHWAFYDAINFVLSRKIYSKLSQKIKGYIWRYDNKYFVIRMIKFEHFSMTISDEFFSELGKPFAITVVLP